MKHLIKASMDSSDPTPKHKLSVVSFSESDKLVLSEFLNSQSCLFKTIWCGSGYLFNCNSSSVLVMLENDGPCVFSLASKRMPSWKSSRAQRYGSRVKIFGLAILVISNGIIDVVIAVVAQLIE
jgi:hypothetical protein